MKKIFTNLFLLATLFLASTHLFAQTYNGGTWYSLYDTGQNSNVNALSPNFAEKGVFAPAESITFQYMKYSWLSSNGKVEVHNKVNGTDWSGAKGSVSYSDYKNWKTSSTIALDENISHIRYSMTEGTGVYVKNHFVKLKKHILIADGGFGKDEESKSFGNVTIGNVSTVQTVKLRSFLTAGNITITSNNPAFRVGSSSNQGAHPFNVGANACASTNGAAGTPAGGGTLGDINLYDINIYFVPTVAGEQSGTITISDGTSSATISVSGVGMKKTQTIAWAEALKGDNPTLPIGKKISSPANAQTEITYSVENDTIISINGNTLTALKTGTTTITATAAETNEWLEVTSTITVKVTEKKVQYIHWNDNLTRFKVGDEAFTLTATASILIDAENEITEPAPERNQYISYQSENPAVVSVEGNTLYINGEGETILTAILQGDEEYEEAIATMPVRVRVPSTTCESNVLDAPGEFSITYSLLGEVRIYEPTAFSGPGHILTFEARKNNSTAVGNIQIQQYVNGSWKDIDDVNPGTDWRAYRYELDRKATKIRFYNGYGSYKRYFKNVLVSQATYLETTAQPITVEKSIIGDEITRTIAIQYSNIPAGVIISNNVPEVVLSDYELGNDCGTHGEKQITVTIRPTEIGVIEDVITIHDEATGKKLEIPVTVHTQRNTQTITWEQDLANINTTDNITLNAKAKTEVYYTSSDSTIAYADGKQLIINKYGHVTIKAVATQDENYEQATVSKEMTINTVQPTVFVWPTVGPIAYAQPLTTDLLMGGEAEVEGYFDWNTEHTELNQTLVPGTYDLAVRFIPTNANYYAPVDSTVSVTINKSAQSIVWNDSFENITVTDSIVLNASAQTTITYEVSDMELAYITENNVLYFLHGGTVQVTAYAEENAYYLADTLTRELTILPGKPIIVRYPTATDITYGQTLSESILEGGEASTAGSFEWKESVALPNAGAGWQYVRFTPDDQESFEPVDFQVEVHVNKATQTITWELEVPVIVPMGQSLPLNAVASSGLPITYILDNDLIASIEEGVFTALEIGQVNLTATQDGTYMDEFGDEYTNYFEADPVSYTITIVAKDVNTGTDLTFPEVKATKIIRDGRLYIIRNGHTYNVNGQVVE